ncbi:hypothetical protein H632_c1709p1 [Helicosporidium sp. ATCC 50920]|nr:hypothetical protein H632_c1709p1 [Helicosporidium sp. ATCC 50920]|eukprot:KDD73944.1 hypothetical protein H632_c1709p1 [Helicosporidium sp. ATCC 50920]
MVTGDNVHTARHIARECGILGEGDGVLEGPEFRAMSRAQVLAALPRLRALARTTDGFRVAALDLEARGAGEVFGFAQSGTSTRARGGCQAELPRDAALVAPARDAALRLARTLPLDEWSPELCALVAGDDLEHLDLFQVGGVP